MRFSFALSSSSGADDAIRANAAGDPWVSLALAIVAQAALDYKAVYAYQVLREQRDTHAIYQGNVVEIEQFFRSRWFGVLANIDGEELLQRLRRKVEQEVLR